MLGETIKNLRLSKGFSSRKLSEAVGKSTAYISQIENGRNNKPDAYIVLQILTVLGLSDDKINNILDQYNLTPKTPKMSLDPIQMFKESMLTSDGLKKVQEHDAEKLFQIIKTIPSGTVEILMEKLKNDNLL